MNHGYPFTVLDTEKIYDNCHVAMTEWLDFRTLNQEVGSSPVLDSWFIKIVPCMGYW